jgi:hypothetical protein
METSFFRERGCEEEKTDRKIISETLKGRICKRKNIRISETLKTIKSINTKYVKERISETLKARICKRNNSIITLKSVNMEGK